METLKKTIFKTETRQLLLAIDDVYDNALASGVSYNLDVLANDSLGITPTTITSINTTGLSSDIAVPTIGIGGLSINLLMGNEFASGVTYTFTYTITDSESNTSTATVSFQDVS